MDFITWGRSPWDQLVPNHASWTLAWVALGAGLVFLIGHAVYVMMRPAPPPDPAQLAAARELAARVPARVLRHSLGARLFHWIMAAAMIVLLVTAFLPMAGVTFSWVLIHWVAGLVLTASILYHVVHASVVLDFWSIWPTREEYGEQVIRFRRAVGQTLPPPRKFGKYPFENKMYHLAIIATGLAATATGLFMLKRVPTGFLERNPYVFGDVTWGAIYVLHGFAGLALITLTIVHVYFAVRPEKRPVTLSMLSGWTSREDYLDHHDPQRWAVAVEPPQPSTPDRPQIVG